MNKLIRPLNAQARELAKNFGFHTAGSLLVKDDDLVRVIQVQEARNASTTDRVGFDLIFDIGIPVISTITPTSRAWVVRCNGSDIGMDSNGGNRNFLLSGESSDEEVIQNALSRIEVACEEFLLRYEDRHALYALVRDSALQWISLGALPQDEFNRLYLYPWNIMGRIELAGVYAAFLGLEEEADFLVDSAVRYAVGKNKGLEYLTPGIRRNVANAKLLSAGRP